MSQTRTAIVIWGNQLLDPQIHSALLQDEQAPVLLIESKQACRVHRYHKQKLLLVLTAMREYADELRAAGRTVHYVSCDTTDDNWTTSLAKLCDQLKLTKLIAMRQNDRSPQLRLERWSKRHEIELSITPNVMFLTPQSVFYDWAEERKVLQMETFYRWQRKRLNILMEGSKPEGGKWNFDHENRKPLPNDKPIPDMRIPKISRHREDIMRLIDTHFKDHPGSYETNWLPTNRSEARLFLKDFLSNRFHHFGDYEDAMKAGQPFLFHSALSALMNIGLLHPQEVCDEAVTANVPLAAKEGFIRQIIGWREFMFGLYHFKAESWKQDNVLKHSKLLEDWWWRLDSDATTEPPLKDVIHRLHKYGYSHHIERLMVLGNYMLLSKYSPQEVYDWFMSMYVDAYEWVMVPNIIGMSQYADGGLQEGGFATKPYISGSNYLQKMGKWWPTAAAAKESTWTPLYWDFLSHHYDRFRLNHRLAPLLRNVKKE